MTISIKHRSGDTILRTELAQAAQQQHDFVADSYRTLYPVPVKVRKHRPMTIGMLLQLRLNQLTAKSIAKTRAKRKLIYGF
jgi:predicted metalloprotease with PDZ domain